MSPTRRDTLKAAGAASGLAMLGGHAVAQQDTAEGDEDGPGAQTLESGQGAVRVGHFVSGAPAVNVRLVPSEGTDTSGSDDDEIGGSGTDDPGGNETETATATETETATATDAGAGGNTSDDNTTEDLQVGNESNGSDAGNETGGMGGNETDDGVGTTDDASDGEGMLIAENVSFGNVSEYTSVEAGDYTVQLLAADGETGDTGTDAGTAGNATDDGMGGNTTGNTSEDLQFGNDSNESSADNATGTDNGTGAGDGNESDEHDGMFSGGILDDSDGNESDDENGGMAGNETDDENGGMAGNETGGMGGNETDDGVGTTDDDTGGEVIYEEEITVGETYYTVAAVGTGTDDIDLHVLRDYDAAQIRLVHASPDAPGVDVVAPDASMTLFDHATFATATDYVGIPPGNYSLSVREATEMNDGDEVGTFDVEVESGEAYSVYAVGSPADGEEEFDLVVTQDGEAADAELAQDDASGQQDEPGTPGADDDETGNETDTPGDDAGPGQGNGTGNGTAADGNATGEDTVPSDPPEADNGTGNASGNGTGNESDDEDDGGILAF